VSPSVTSWTFAVDLVCAAEMVEEAVEAHHRDGGEQERKDEDDSDEYRLRSRAGEDAVLVAAGENGYRPAGPEELDSSQGHHVGEEVRAETDEVGYPGRRVVRDPAQGRTQDRSQGRQADGSQQPLSPGI